MSDLAVSDLKCDGWRSRFAALVASREDWLMGRVLDYAKLQGYVKYTSTLFEAWRASVQGLSTPLIEALARDGDDLELGPDIDFSADPGATFGVLEAQRHRTRGISLALFLGLTKYYGDTYLDLAEQFEGSAEERGRVRRFVRRFFDRVELGFCSEWSGLTETVQMQDMADANRRLTNEKNRLLTILESLNDPVIFFEQDHQIGLINNAAARIFTGRETPGAEYYAYCDTATDGPGRPVLECFDDAFHRRFSASKEEVQSEEMLETVHGPAWFDIKSRPMLDISGKFSGHVVIFTDISDRKRSETTLRTLFRAIESCHNGIVITDETQPNHRVVYVNPGFEAITGYTVAETAGRSCGFLHGTDTDQPGLKQLRAALGTHQPTGVILRNYRKSGDMFWNHLQIAPVSDATGAITHTIGVISDISERMQADRLRTLGTIAAGIAHELNNPLMGVENYVRYALDRTEPGKPRQCLEKADRQLQRMATILGGMTSFVRAGGGSAGLVAMPPVIEHSLDLLHSDFEKRGIRVTVTVEDALPLVIADAQGLQQVLVNLLVNARDALEGSTDKHIRISARSRRDGVSLEVADNGSGISPEAAGRIFEPFFTTKAVGHGTGLGLAICQQIIGAAGGTISCRNGPNGGTSFVIEVRTGDSAAAA